MNALARPLPALAALAIGLAGCAPPSVQSLYSAYRERGLWAYDTRFEGQGTTYDGRLELRTSPQPDGTTQVEVRILPGSGPAPGGRQQYTLDLRSSPPRIVGLATNGGRATLEPSLPLPGLEASSGAGAARYAPERGRFRGTTQGFRWSYQPRPGGTANTPAGRFPVVRADLAYRGDVALTDSNLRLEVAPGVGVVRAEWKTTYGTTTRFQLRRHERRPPS